MSSPSSITVPTLEVDAVVVGSGIQGLWLLADLIDMRYEAVLLERMRPNFGQTGHSHVFLHEGHIYAGTLADRAGTVLQANRLWKTALEGGRLNQLDTIRSNFYVGWGDQRKADQFETNCETAAIPCESIDVPPTEFGALPTFEKLYKSEGVCIDSKLLVEELLNHGDLKDRLAYAEDISLEGYDSGKFTLLVKRPKDNSRPSDRTWPLDNDNPKSVFLKIRTASLILSAGAGNERLIKRVSIVMGIPNPLDATRQQTVKTYMLVVRHQHKSLPPVCGMFPDVGGLFIVSRIDNGKTVWLIGDRQREVVSFPGEFTAFDAVVWFQKVRDHLTRLLSTLTSNPDDFEWGIYEATKAEPWTDSDRFKDGGAFPHGYHVYNHPTAQLWLVWPTLLTLAPLVSASITADLKKVVTPRSSTTNWSLWNNFRKSIDPLNCRWKTTPLLPWEEFKRCYTV